MALLSTKWVALRPAERQFGAQSWRRKIWSSWKQLECPGGCKPFIFIVYHWLEGFHVLCDTLSTVFFKWVTTKSSINNSFFFVQFLGISTSILKVSVIYKLFYILVKHCGKGRKQDKWVKHAHNIIYRRFIVWRRQRQLFLQWRCVPYRRIKCVISMCVIDI